MSHVAANLEEIISRGVEDLLARAADARSLDKAALLPRVRATLDKYLLRDAPGASASDIQKFIAELHADDLCLAVACERGDEAAWAELFERYRAAVLSAARSVSASADAADELAQSIWAELYGLRSRDGGGPAGKLAYYSGRGSLGGWLRAVVGQLAVDRHRKQARLVQTEDSAAFDRLPPGGVAGGERISAIAAHDPERALAATESARDLHAALARALGELAAEDRLLVKLYYFDNLRLREAGAVLGVHEATASRRLARLHAEIRRRVEAILIKERGWKKDETARAFAEEATRLDADLGPLLATETAPGEALKSDVGG
jgi:RNA polymerase sigma-70 factor (ECF subfamily)